MKHYLAKVRLKLNMLRHWNRGMKFKITGQDTDIHIMWNMLSYEMKNDEMKEWKESPWRNKTIVNGVSMVVPNSKFDLPTALKAGKKS